MARTPNHKLGITSTARAKPRDISQAPASSAEPIGLPWTSSLEHLINGSRKATVYQASALENLNKTIR